MRSVGRFVQSKGTGGECWGWVGGWVVLQTMRPDSCGHGFHSSTAPLRNQGTGNAPPESTINKRQ